MEEKKFLGMSKKVCLGLGWLTLVIAIIALAIEHPKMTKDEKKQFVSVFVGYGCACIAWTVISIVQVIINHTVGPELGWIFTIVGFLVWCVMLVCMVFAFMNEDFHAPVFFNLAGKFVADGEDAKAETVEAEVVEEEKEEEQPEEK